MQIPDTFFLIQLECGETTASCGPYKTFIAAAEASLDLVPQLAFLYVPAEETGPITTSVLECALVENKVEIIDVRGTDRQDTLIHSR